MEVRDGLASLLTHALLLMQTLLTRGWVLLKPTTAKHSPCVTTAHVPTRPLLVRVEMHAVRRGGVYVWVGIRGRLVRARPVFVSHRRRRRAVVHGVLPLRDAHRGIRVLRARVRRSGASRVH